MTRQFYYIIKKAFLHYKSIWLIKLHNLFKFTLKITAII